MKKRANMTATTFNQFKKVVETRRSVRKFTNEAIPDEVVNECLDLALLAPNSSNLQMWQFYRIKSAAAKKKMAAYCLNQQSAKTAAELIVCTGSTRNWKKHSKMMVDYWPNDKVPKVVRDYYQKLTFINYGAAPLDPFGLAGLAKKTVRDIVGLKQPMMRWPNTEQDLETWAAKSVALGCENLMLAFRAAGYDTCAMEGFDEARIKKLCKLKKGEFVVMVIAAGRCADDGIYHEQIRFERERFVHEI